jgi:hypothetical protein
MRRYILNPLSDDVTIDVDKMGKNPQTFTLKAGQIEQFEDHVCLIFEDKIVSRMLWKTMPASHNREERTKEILDIVRVNDADVKN